MQTRVALKGPLSRTHSVYIKKKEGNKRGRRKGRRKSDRKEGRGTGRQQPGGTKDRERLRTEWKGFPT